MCVVSNMGDMGRGMWPKPWGSPYKTPSPYQPAVPMPGIDYPAPPPFQPAPSTTPTREQFEEFLELLRAARKFDIKTGQKDCPMKDKLKWLLELADFLGVPREKISEALA